MLKRTWRQRNISSGIYGPCALVARQKQEVVGGAADIEEAGGVDDKDMPVNKSRSFNDLPLVLRRRMCVTAT